MNLTETKILSMCVLGISSFLAGLLALKLSRHLNRYPLVLSFLLCFGGGVLLATSLAHMLPEVRGVLGELAEIWFCFGFFILYFVDELSHYFLGDGDKVIHHSSTEKQNYQTESETESSRLDDIMDCSISVSSSEPKRLKRKCYGSNNTCDQQKTRSFSAGREIKVDQHYRYTAIATSSEYDHHHSHQNACHVEVGQPCSANIIGMLGLLLALLVHSILEGTSIGVQTDEEEVLLVLSAVSVHKIVLALCLGAELSSGGYSCLSFIGGMFLFSIGSPLGIAAGMSLTSSASTVNIVPLIQAIAGGSLFYVAAFEVLPRERSTWQHKPSFRLAGLLQFLSVFVGFAAMGYLNMILDSDELVDINKNSTAPS